MKVISRAFFFLVLLCGGSSYADNLCSGSSADRNFELCLSDLQADCIQQVNSVCLLPDGWESATIYHAAKYIEQSCCGLSTTKEKKKCLKKASKALKAKAMKIPFETYYGPLALRTIKAQVKQYQKNVRKGVSCTVKEAPKHNVDCQGSVSEQFRQCLVSQVGQCVTSNSTSCSQSDGERILALQLSVEAAVSCCSLDASCFKFRRKHLKKMKRKLPLIFGSDFVTRTEEMVNTLESAFNADRCASFDGTSECYTCSSLLK